MMCKNKFGIFIFLIFIYAIVLRMYNIFEPLVTLGSGKVSPSSGFNNAVYSIAARNFVRYGYIDFGLGQILNTGRVAPEEFVYYITHPPLSALLTSISIRIFGMTEWSVQLVPAAFFDFLLDRLFFSGESGI
ncbi:MAG: hypothetical protein KatS3mg131_3779 [Candidatus Tectimicrobiota bacterium]|nr:MAG: hypothetical protein KatS3mg131_3779 [Candidatus Tectomicrobia bacterium]